VVQLLAVVVEGAGGAGAGDSVFHPRNRLFYLVERKSPLLAQEQSSGRCRLRKPARRMPMGSWHTRVQVSGVLGQICQAESRSYIFFSSLMAVVE
jgi:hypothetical protein